MTTKPEKDSIETIDQVLFKWHITEKIFLQDIVSVSDQFQ